MFFRGVRDFFACVITQLDEDAEYVLGSRAYDLGMVSGLIGAALVVYVVIGVVAWIIDTIF